MTRALELRALFDGEFAAAARPPDPAHRDFLYIRVGGEPAAIALDDIMSLHADLRVIALPTRAPALLGVAAIRAAIVPIYDLAVAFGAASTGMTRWVVVVRDGAAGFAFEGYDGHARVADRSIALSTQPGHMRGQLSAGGAPRAIVDLGSVRAAIEARWSRPVTGKDP